MKWQIVHSGVAHASEHMRRDYELLQQLESITHPLFHDYSWEGDSATFGHFIDPFQFLNKTAVVNRRLNLAKRPTGGGIIFHLTDLAFSVLVPATHPGYSLNTLENYAFVNEVVSQSIATFLGKTTPPKLLPHDPVPLDASCQNFCMAKPTKFDVMLDGRKVGGGAQRRTKFGFLHQGTISLAMPKEDFLQEILLPNTCVLPAMKEHSYLLLGSSYSLKQLEDARDALKGLLKQNFLMKNHL